MRAYSEDLRERVIGAVGRGERAATWAAFATITLADTAGWFAHCGYLG